MYISYYENNLNNNNFILFYSFFLIYFKFSQNIENTSEEKYIPKKKVKSLTTTNQVPGLNFIVCIVLTTQEVKKVCALTP